MITRAQTLIRQYDLIPGSILDEPITLIGAGAVGGWTTLALAKMGFSNLTVFDHDTVEVENMNSQIYPLRAIGQLKVDALRQLVADFTGVEIEAIPRRWEAGEAPRAGLTIAAVDSMAARRTLWEGHRDNLSTRAFLDPRMGAEEAVLYVVTPHRPAEARGYEKTLHSDAEAVQERCTAKATIYTANLLAGLVCKAVKDRLTRPDYLKMAQWSIKENDLICHKARV